MLFWEKLYFDVFGLKRAQNIYMHEIPAVERLKIES